MMKTKKMFVKTTATLTEDDECSTEEDKSAEDSEQNQEYNEELDNSEDDDGVVNSGWADCISKILNTSKPKGKKSVILSKAKKIADVKKVKVKDAGFEVEAKDGQIKRQIEEADEDEGETEKPLRKRKKDLPIIRVKPDILNKDRERFLSKIATRGVVQLFNAVKKQQKDIDSKLKDAGSVEVKRDKVLKNIDKREFLNVLMGGKNSNLSDLKKEKKSIPMKKEHDDAPTWDVLRDDFMMSAKMKDWDKQLEDGDDDVEVKDDNSDSA